MRPEDTPIINDLNDKLDTFIQNIPLPGIVDAANRDCFVRQMVDSIRRIKYVKVIRDKPLSDACADPSSIGFDPIKAAAWHRRQGNIDEAFWLVFIATHFGKNIDTGWNLARGVYGGLGNVRWDWATVSANPNAFRDWLNTNQNILRQNGKFGNHRKFESLNAYRRTGTGEAVATYVAWVGNNGNHIAKINSLVNPQDSTPRATFASLYKSLNQVKRFGRTGKFDYLTMIGKLGLADVEPDSTYMTGATGPHQGAELLFGVHVSRREFNEWLNALEDHLGLYYGMQVLEDAICNWQKNPGHYRYFGG